MVRWSVASSSTSSPSGGGGRTAHFHKVHVVSCASTSCDRIVGTSTPISDRIGQRRDAEAVGEQLVADARALIDRAERVTVLTGAGISTDSGISDFRGPNGL